MIKCLHFGALCIASYFICILCHALYTAFTLKFMSFKGADICRRLMSICSKTFSPLRSLIDYSEPLGCFRQSLAKVRNVWRPGARLVTIATFVMAPRFSSAFTIWGAFEFSGGAPGLFCFTCAMSSWAEFCFLNPFFYQTFDHM